eukprot:jgi/Tetstr1/425435/TSEL_015882.t1
MGSPSAQEQELSELEWAAVSGQVLEQKLERWGQERQWPLYAAAKAELQRESQPAAEAKGAEKATMMTMGKKEGKGVEMRVGEAEMRHRHGKMWPCDSHQRHPKAPDGLTWLRVSA